MFRPRPVITNFISSSITPSKHTYSVYRTQARQQDRSFNFNDKATITHCSLPTLMCPSNEAAACLLDGTVPSCPCLKCPGDEVRSPSRWCGAELATPSSLKLCFNDKTAADTTPCPYSHAQAMRSARLFDGTVPSWPIPSSPLLPYPTETYAYAYTCAYTYMVVVHWMVTRCLEPRATAKTSQSQHCL